ncbi:MAG: nuclear transport factor 2 family protein [Saprospiraceae bacterium]|nr:nuclear transport factor 2 family protein [Saprospiraceae bacterium]
MSSIRLLFLLCFTFITIQIAAQKEAAKWQAEIDQEIWLPFTQAYQDFDGKAFNALHSDDVLRVGPWGIRQGVDYKQSNLSGYRKNKKAGKQRKIFFWLEHRQTTSELSYEVGYYKVSITSQAGTTDHYARFHVLIRKIDSQWKIVQDWDTSSINGHQVTAEDFEKGADRILKF